MNAYYNLVGRWIVLLLIISNLNAFSDQQLDVLSNKKENWIFDSSKKKEYLQLQKDYYKVVAGINDKKDNASDHEMRLIDFIQTNFPNEEKWTDKYQKLMEISALCYAAADIQCPTPIILFPELFDYTIYAYEKYYGKNTIEDQLEDHPFMFLAVQCGEKSIPALKSLIYNKKVRSELRLTAFAILMKINSKEGEESALELKKDFSPEMNSILTSYLKNPLVEPWDIIPRFSNRAREISKRKLGE